MRMAGMRRQILGLTLTLVGIAWGIDALTGAGTQPAPAAGATTDNGQPAPAGSDAVSSSQILQLIAALRQNPQDRPTLQIQRDMFLPTASSWGADRGGAGRAASQTGGAPDAAGPTGDEAAPEPPPQLHAILAGRLPMALIDGRVVSCGGVVRGYRVEHIGREGVRLRRGLEVLTLRLRPASTGGAQ